MGRKVAITGVALVAVGIVLLLWGQPAPQVNVTNPIDRAANLLLELVPVVGAMAATVGGIMLGLAVVMTVAGLPTPSTNPPALLWLALGAVALASVVEVVMSLSLSGEQSTGLLFIAHATAVLRTIGAALLAWWLTARMTHAEAPAPRSLVDHAAAS